MAEELLEPQNVQPRNTGRGWTMKVMRIPIENQKKLNCPNSKPKPPPLLIMRALEVMRVQIIMHPPVGQASVQITMHPLFPAKMPYPVQGRVQIVMHPWAELGTALKALHCIINRGGYCDASVLRMKAFYGST
jgi:hypothetical protein